MVNQNSNMRLSWWLGRFKRLVPVIIVVIIGSRIWKNLQSQQSVSAKVNDMGTLPGFHDNIPTPTPGPPGWVVMQVTEQDGNPCNRLAAAFAHWIVLLVDFEKNHHTSHSNCRYLSRNDTRELLRKHRLAAEDSILAGIIYAIQNDAQAFYIPPLGSTLQQAELPVLPDERRTHWLTASVSLKSAKFSSLRHFGCNRSSVLPHEEEQDDNAAAEYKFTAQPPPAIFAPADIDHKTQWARGFNGEKVELKTCDEAAPSVVLERGTYGDLRLDGAKVNYVAAWAYSSCMSGHAQQQHRDCDAWNIVVQNLLWKTGYSAMLYYNNDDNNSSSSAMRFKSQGLQLFLKKWSCPMESCMDCGINLMDQLTQSGYLSSDFTSKQITWFKALNAAFYRFPEMKKKALSQHTLASNVIFNPVNFTDKLPWLKGRKRPYIPVANSRITELFFHQLCDASSSNDRSSISLNFSSPWMQLDDILLIVVFNSPYYNNIRYIEAMYRMIFPRILYCGPYPIDAGEFPWIKDYSLSFVMFDGDTNHTAGAFSYDCMIKAIAMNYKVSGYLVMADDLFLLPQSLAKYSKRSMWFIPPDEVRIGEITKLRECRLGMCDFHPHWHWWEDYQRATIDALTSLKQLKYSDTYHRCYKQLVSLNGGELRPNGAYSDIYYVPAGLQQQVHDLFKHFLRHRVFVEIAVPTVINCLVGTTEVQKLPGKQVWDVTRDVPWVYFSNKHLIGKKYLHPTKWSYIESGSTEMRDLFCRDVIPFLFDPYQRIEKNRRH